MSRQNKELKHKHLFDGTAWNVYDPTLLNLSVGAPGPDLLEPCCDIFQQATAHCLTHEKNANNSLIFQYGPTIGTYGIRKEVAKFFSEMYTNSVNCEDLIITAGATQGLHFVLSTLIDFSGYIFVDEYTYMIALDSMKHFTSLKIVPLKLNDDGVDLDDLDTKVRERHFKSENKEFWAIYYTVPTYHNPTGILFSPAVCHGIVQLARKYDFLVLCDDVYNILHYGEKPLIDRLLSYDARTDADFVGNVIANGSFSKLIGPGVRLGWLEVPPRVKQQLDSSGIIHSGGGFNNYTSCIVASLFELQLAQSHIKQLHEAYKERMLATIEVLKSELPKCCHFVPPSGGFFIWIRLPDQLNARNFMEYCMERERITFIVGSRFAVEEGKGQQFFRITIGFYNKEKLVDGVKRLCLTLQAYMKTVDMNNC
ncbi:2-aminoadipate transaminase [Drosophila montana]|uniref:2-aminoadipate transaminase n=1 Tax=Drosophila montana TaxID=40370 RepID=UPI00313BFA48